MILFATSDRIGKGTGGGIVTLNELEALQRIGPVDIYNPQPTANPFDADNGIDALDLSKYRLAHFYAGTFPKLTQKLKERGVKITYTAAAHDIDVSQKEFIKAGVNYDFPHITNPELWATYLSSYLNADCIICPSKHSAQIMNKFGCGNITVIPHGCHPGADYRYPKSFSVGYLGQIGPDKGVRYLIEAWEMCNLPDAVLTLAGNQSPMLVPLIRQFGCKANYNILGYVNTIDDFFKSINLYVQPSVTEGFGIEVLEAMAFGRPVISTKGVGASDCLHEYCRLIDTCDVKAISNEIRSYYDNMTDMRSELMKHSAKYDWSVIKDYYVDLWKGMLDS